jgi:acetoin utilization deacetylase AcuC-like enzyme
MGFCLLNNVALAAAHARALGARRVLVVDFDVHHGNGTQDAFYGDPSVLFLSLHQYPFYPGTGAASETGVGEGSGFTVNVPLSAGADDSAYFAAFDRLVLPIAESYAPDIALVSAGFDAHRNDPLGGMRLSSEAYGRMTRGLTRTLGPTPVGMFLEGGYDLDALETSLVASLEGMMGEASPTGESGGGPAAPSGPHAADLERARLAARPFWRLP